MLEDARQVLNRLGLKDAEISVYAALLENKQGLFVSEITKAAKIKRSTVNLILDRLTKKGFITYHLDGARKLFSAEQPESILFRFEDSLNDLRGLIPLLRITSGSDKKTKVRFFEGREGVEKIFTDILLAMKVSRDPNKEIVAVSSGKDIFKILPDHQKQFMDKRAKERVPLRWIAPESEISRGFDTGQKDARTMKFFDGKKYQFNIEIDVYGDKIALINLDKEPNGVIIENRPLATSFKSLFNLLWDSIR